MQISLKPSIGSLVFCRLGLLAAVGFALASDGVAAQAQRPDHVLPARSQLTVAPIAAAAAPGEGAAGICTVPPQNPNAPSAPADLTAMLLQGGTTSSVAVVINQTGLTISRLTFNDQGQQVCRHEQTVTWEEFWSNTETQDIVRKAAEAHKLISFAGLSSAPFGDVAQSPAAITGDSVYVAALADSSIGNDQALFIAAAKVGSNPARLNWRLFRIQLISIDGALFCMPSATAFALNLRVGGSPLGRLFIAFDSIDQDFTTSGSILDIDVTSLLRGDPIRVQCFTGPAFAGLAPPDVRDVNQNAYFFGIRNIAAVKRYRLHIARRVAADSLIATPDIDIPAFDFNPAAVQPNGVHLDAGGFEFTRPSIQIGNASWNIHQVGDDGGHAKLRLYKFAPAVSTPKLALTLATLPDGSDDLIAPSFELDGTEAFVTFTRTIAADAINGKATLMMARGPHSSSAGWASTVLAESTGQFTKNTAGNPCDTFEFAGCLYGPNSATQIDTVNNMVWGFGEIITKGALGTGRGNEVNWAVKGIGVPR